jgi:hypothetical protein
MGEGTNRVEPGASGDRPVGADQLTEQVEHSRVRLDSLVSELDHRRHVVANIKRRIQRRPGSTAALAVLCLGAIATVVTFALRRQRRRQSFTARARRLGKALSRVGSKPERLSRPQPEPLTKLLASAGSAATGVLIKHLAGRVLAPAQKEPRTDRRI